MMEHEAMRRKIATVQSMHRKAAEMTDAAKAQHLSASAEGAALRDLILAGESTGDSWLDLSIRINPTDLTGEYGKLLSTFYEAMYEHQGQMVLLSSVSRRSVGCSGFGATPRYIEELSMGLGILDYFTDIKWPEDKPVIPLVRSVLLHDVTPRVPPLAEDLPSIYAHHLMSRGDFYGIYAKPLEYPQRYRTPDCLRFHVLGFVGNDAIDELFADPQMQVYESTFRWLCTQLDYDPARLFN